MSKLGRHRAQKFSDRKRKMEKKKKTHSAHQIHHLLLGDDHQSIPHRSRQSNAVDRLRRPATEVGDVGQKEEKIKIESRQKNAAETTTKKKKEIRRRTRNKMKKEKQDENNTKGSSGRNTTEKQKEILHRCICLFVGYMFGGWMYSIYLSLYALRSALCIWRGEKRVVEMKIKIDGKRKSK